MRKNAALFSVLLISTFLLIGTSCSSKHASHSEVTNQLIHILEGDARIKKLVEKSINLAAINNPDRKTNPVRNLNELYDFIDYSLTCMPWNISKDDRFDDFATKCDQSILYVYYLLDQPLEELANMNLFYNSVEYLDPLVRWFVNYNNSWRDFLDSPESWKDEYYQMLLKDPTWNLDKGWYEDSSNWHSFNQFFSRKLKEGARPISLPNQENIIVSPADSLPQGIWDFRSDGTLEADPIKNEQGVIIKSSVWISAEQLLGEEKGQEDGYAQKFYGGTLTHTYLNYDDYHRYHFPVSGKIVACYKIPYANAVGGIVYWDKVHEKYFLESDSLSWQVVETRGVVIVDTTGFANKGLVAIMPIGMGQVSSVNFEDNVKIGETITKGDPLGYFLFGGSDVVMLFEKSARFAITVKRNKEESGYYGGFEHVKCRESYGVFDGHNS